MKNNCLYTSFANDVLLGITRQKTIAIAKKLGIEVIEGEIDFDDLNNYEAAFLTGTSPKILPIKNIAGVSFDVTNDILQKLIDSYNLRIQEYITKNSRS